MPPPLSDEARGGWWLKRNLYDYTMNYKVIYFIYVTRFESLFYFYLL